MKIHKDIFLAQDIDGFLTNREGQLLYSLAAACTGKGVIVEIGSWKGKSTVWLAKGVEVSGKTTVIYAIDPHTGSPEHQKDNAKVWTFDEFQSNIRKAGVESLIKPIIKFSAEAVTHIQNPIELLFIDGAHEYDAVLEDYELYAPLVCEGGFIAFHDTPWPGVDQLMGEVLPCDGFKNVYFTDTLLVGVKTKKVTAKERFKTRLMLWLNRQFQKACTSKAPKTFRTLWKNAVKFLRDITFRI
jgi:MMP 1-O-methyltransferase